MALQKFESRNARRRRPFDLTHSHHRDVSAPPVLPFHLELVAGLIMATVLLLASAHVFTTLLPLLHGQNPPEWAHQFDLGRENNVPTWVASTTLLLCAGLLGIVAATKYRERDRFRWHWLVLAAGFVVLSMDEAASLHEFLGRALESRIPLTGYFYYGSILPLLACVGFVAVAYTQFLLHLPLPTRVACVLAALLYVGGALGCEMLESREEFATQSQATAVYHFLVFLEEVMELSGVAVFFWAMTRYLRLSWGELCLSYGRETADTHPSNPSQPLNRLVGQ